MHKMEPMMAQGYAYSDQPQVVMSQPVAGHTTTIINVQPTVSNPLMPRGIPRDWTTGLCAICDDIGICLCVLFVPCHPCILASEMNESVCTPCCVPAASIVMRSHFRGVHNIQGSLLNDCCVSCWCSSCSACQLAREVKMVKAGQAMA